MLEDDKIFVAGLNYATTEQQLVEKFAEFGTIINSRIIRDHQTGKSKGFAFITFAKADAASNAIKEMDLKNFDGRVVSVRLAYNKRASE